MTRTPLDAIPEERTFLIRVARLYSDIFSPPSTFAMFGFVLAWFELPFWKGSLHAAIFGICSTLLPILYILHRMKIGRITDIHISEPKDRQVPYLLGVIGAGLAFLVLKKLGSSPLLLTFILGNILAVGMLTIINSYWLISAHTTSISLIAVFAGIAFNPTIGLSLIVLVGLTFSIRLFLRRHTVSELVAGLLLGSLIALSLRAYGAFP